MNARSFTALLAVICGLTLTRWAAAAADDLEGLDGGLTGDANVKVEVWEPILATFYIEAGGGASAVRGPEKPVELTLPDGRAIIGEWEAWRTLKPLIIVRTLQMRQNGVVRYDRDCVYSVDDQVLSGWRRRVSESGAVGFDVRSSANASGQWGTAAGSGGTGGGILIEKAEPTMGLFLDLDILTNTGPDDRSQRIKKGEIRIVEVNVTAYKISNDLAQYRQLVMTENEDVKPPAGALTSFPIIDFKGNDKPWEDLRHIGINFGPMMGEKAGVWEFRAKAVMEARFGANDPGVKRTVEGAIRVGFKLGGFVPVKIGEERQTK